MPSFIRYRLGFRSYSGKTEGGGAENAPPGGYGLMVRGWCESVRIFTWSRFEWCEFGPSGVSAHSGGLFVCSAAANNHPYFQQRESKVLYVQPHPFFRFKLYCDGYLWCDFRSDFFFCLIGSFWCEFSTGPVRLAETGEILYSLGATDSVRYACFFGQNYITELRHDTFYFPTRPYYGNIQGSTRRVPQSFPLYPRKTTIFILS